MAKRPTKDREAPANKARDLLMYAMMAAFYDTDLTDAMRDKMHQEVNKVEKVLGYRINTWKA